MKKSLSALVLSAAALSASTPALAQTSPSAAATQPNALSIPQRVSGALRATMGDGGERKTPKSNAEDTHRTVIFITQIGQQNVRVEMPPELLGDRKILERQLNTIKSMEGTGKWDNVIMFPTGIIKQDGKIRGVIIKIDIDMPSNHSRSPLYLLWLGEENPKTPVKLPDGWLDDVKSTAQRIVNEGK